MIQNKKIKLNAYNIIQCIDMTIVKWYNLFIGKKESINKWEISLYFLLFLNSNNIKHQILEYYFYQEGKLLWDEKLLLTQTY